MNTTSLIRHTRIVLVIIGFCTGMGGCVTGPQLPAYLNGQAAIVLGFTADEAAPYEGGTLYTGLRIHTLDGNPIGPPSLKQYDFILVEPGKHVLQGYCYWQLRGVMGFKDDLQEPGEITLYAQANHVYTLQSSIDEYKNRCQLSVIERAHQPAH